MSTGYRRSDLQVIAQAKFDDASLLLNNGRAANAYYLAGYAVEIGLKACVARQISAETIPDRSFINDVFRHDLKRLVGLAGLNNVLKDREATDSAFATNWALVMEWTPEARYQSIETFSAQLMVQAVGDKATGVLAWIRQYW